MRCCILSAIAAIATISVAMARGQGGFLGEGAFGLSAPNAESATMTSETVEIVKGKPQLAYRIVVRTPSQPFYLIQAMRSVERPVVAGTRMRLRFWARSTTPGGHLIRACLERSDPPYTGYLDDSLTLSPKWTPYILVGTVSSTYPAKGMSVHFQVGSKAGVVELAGVTLEDFGTDPNLVAARTALEPRAIADRIRKYRMAPITVKVVDRSGKPVPGAVVEISQTRHAFLFGSNIFALNPAASADPWQKNYQQKFEALFNYATLPFYWGAFESRKGEKDFARIDAMAKWCLAHGITPKGHPLTYHLVYPDWAPKDEAVAPLVKARIEEIVRHYAGTIRFWDVFNEVHDAPTSQTGIGAWTRKVGTAQAVASTLKWARETDPSHFNTYLYNDYKTSPVNEQLLDALAARKSLPDAIGIQSHMHGGTWPLTDVWLTAQRFSRFHRPIHFTETTVLSGAATAANASGDGVSTPEGEKQQADYVEKFYTVLFSHPAIRAITWWDLSDRNSWMAAPAGLLRADGTPKPAYNRLVELVKRKWWTRARLTTSSDGLTQTRVFLGDHRLTVRTKGGSQTVDLAVISNANQTVTVKLKLK